MANSKSKQHRIRHTIRLHAKRRKDKLKALIKEKIRH